MKFLTLPLIILGVVLGFRKELASAKATPPPTLKEMILNVSKDTLNPHITPVLLAAVVKVESSNRPDAMNVNRGKPISGTRSEVLRKIDEASDHGICQLNGKTLKAYGVSVEEVYSDPETALRVCSLVLNDCMRREKNNVRHAVACYNGGPGWRRNSAQTLAHADKVLKEIRNAQGRATKRKA